MLNETNRGEVPTNLLAWISSVLRTRVRTKAGDISETDHGIL